MAEHGGAEAGGHSGATMSATSSTAEPVTIEPLRAGAASPLLHPYPLRTRRRGITLRDTLTLSPYQKWKRHGQLPTKLMCASLPCPRDRKLRV